MNETKRQENKKEQLLNALRVRGIIGAGMTNAELSVIALRYGGYIGTLRKEGYEIETESLGDGEFLYTLISEPAEPVVRRKAIDVLSEEAQKYGINSDVLKSILEATGITVRFNANTYAN